MEMELGCDCGKFKGTVDTKYLKGFRAVCLCDDCQAFAHFLKRPDTLDANGGTDIVPVMPSHYKIILGKENLKSVRLVEKGMYRWYADCCKSPIGNAMSSPAMPYIGVPYRIFEKRYSKDQIDRQFGPVTERMQAQFAKGPLPPLARKTVSMGFMLRVLKFILRAKLTGGGSPSPFFLSDGSPAVKPQVLTKEERDALRPLCGTKRTDI
jgi:hypothetical protein